MESFYQYIDEYKHQLSIGTIKNAYRGLMDYILALRAHFTNRYPHFFVSGNIYPGYMDMTYFSLNPLFLKQRKLRIAVVFIHQSCEFQAWLAGYNKQVQSKYWKLFKESGWNKYPIVPNVEGVDSIIEVTLESEPDFRNLAALTEQIESATEEFINHIETFVNALPN